MVDITKLHANDNKKQKNIRERVNQSLAILRKLSQKNEILPEDFSMIEEILNKYIEFSAKKS